MESKKYYKLLKNYFSGKRSPEGERIFDRWFYKIDDNVKPEVQSEENKEEIRKRIQSRLLQTIHTVPEFVDNKRIIPQWTWYAAASVLFIGTISLIFWNDNPHAQTSTSIASDAVISRQMPFIEKVNHTNHKVIIILPDGSKVSLNQKSQIRYPEYFSVDKREVSLIGEAFFEVVRDTVRRFIVTSGKIQTTVLGTSFNVRAYQGQSTIEVLVATGKVSVHNTIENTLVTLLPKQRAVFEEKAAILRKDTLLLSYDQKWVEKDGETIFSDLPLVVALELLHQRFGVSAILQNDNLKNCKVNITLKDKTVSEIMEDICIQTGSKCSLQQDQYVFSGKGCSAQ